MEHAREIRISQEKRNEKVLVDGWVIGTGMFDTIGSRADPLGW